MLLIIASYLLTYTFSFLKKLKAREQKKLKAEGT